MNARTRLYPLSIGYPVNVTVTLAAGHSTTGKMKIDLEAGPSYQRGVYLQPHMQALNEGQSYSAQIDMLFPLEQLREVSLMWFKKKLSFGSNLLLFRQVTLEPLYYATPYEKRLKTVVLCGSIVPTPGKSEYPIHFDINCRSW